LKLKKYGITIAETKKLNGEVREYWTKKKVEWLAHAIKMD
jgi:hypothetical protein